MLGVPLQSLHLLPYSCTYLYMGEVLPGGRLLTSPCQWTLDTRGGWHFWYMRCLLGSSHTCGMITYFNLQPCNHIFLPFDSLTNQKQGGFLLVLFKFQCSICSMNDSLKENIFIVTNLTNQKPGGFAHIAQIVMLDLLDD